MLLAFTGYHKSKVRTALNKIIKRSKKFDVAVTDKPKEHKRQLKFQAKLWGCDVKDLTIYSIPITGTLANAKSLVRTDTPQGVMIELSIQSPRK